MALVIQTNVASLQAQKNLSSSQANLQTSFNRLSSGNRINTAKDDAAGLAISESMKSQIRSFSVAERNAGDAISMAQTAEGALGELTNIVGRMRELAVQASNGALQSSDRAFIQTEFSNLQAETKRIMTSTKFNGKQLITSAVRTDDFQVGINNTADDRITMTFGGIDLKTLTTSGASGTKLGSGPGNARGAIDTIDKALANLSTARARFGAAINRLETTTSNIQTVRLNLSAANSRIRDVDVADETASLSRQQVLTQAGTSVLSQANSSPQAALSLIR
jgi:flagellin